MRSPSGQPGTRRVLLLALALAIAGGLAYHLYFRGLWQDDGFPAAEFGYELREVMIPMRDGVRLKTYIAVPQGVQAAPVLLDRTPYDAQRKLSFGLRHHLGGLLSSTGDDFITVSQDLRGRHGSEGEYRITRPLRGPLNATTTDHATDCYDTIDWLVKHLPESNGRVAVTGSSYDGFAALMCTVHPHPALRAAVPIAPMVDGWMGDDWFHHGAFRQDGTLDFIFDQESGRPRDWWPEGTDTYEAYLRAGSAGAMAQQHGLAGLPFWENLAAHPAYDAYWQEQALDRQLAKEPLAVPMLIVAGLFDQEDIYGGPAVYQALASKDPKGERLHLVLGPWSHGQSQHEGYGIGAIAFDGSDTAAWFRRGVMQPFLDHYLRDAPDPQLPRILAYETGANAWRVYNAWPQACAEGCADTSRRLYLLDGGRLGFAPPTAEAKPYDEYVSDPAHPVPYRARPTRPLDAEESTWSSWLVDDQRHAAGRADVLVYTSRPLEQPLRVAGQPWADLVASSSGSDADWVVKLIDVWPDEVPDQPGMAGYQQMLAADIFRGRYREGWSEARPLKPNEPLAYRIRLPNVSHTFRPGHRLMMQVQSSWFPLYDRNPQSFVPNILFAQPADYRKATQRIWHTQALASAIELPVIGDAAR